MTARHFVPPDVVPRPPRRRNRQLVRRCRQAQLLAVAGAAAVALLAAVGALSGDASLAGFITGGATMKLNAALLVLAVCAATILDGLEIRGSRAASRVLAAFVLAAAVLTLGQDVAGFDAGIDELLSDADAGTSSVRGRMSPITAACLALAAAALIGSGGIRQGLALVALTLAGIAILGYLYSVQALYGVEPFASMSINSALALLLVAAGILASQADVGLTGLLVDGGAGGRATRRLLPAVTLGPAVFGGLHLAGQRAGLYGVEFGVALMVLGSSTLLVALVWMNGRKLRSAEARQDDDERFRALLESAPDGMVIVDNRGHVVLVNSQTERLFGYPRTEVLGKPVEVLMPPRFRRAHAQYRQGYAAEPRLREMGTGQTLYGLRKDGSEFPVEISLSPIDTEQGTLVSATIRDVTERRAIERTLQEKNAALDMANRAKDRFLASMSHELRTPLNAVLGFTGALLMKLPGPLTHEQEEQLRLVQASGRHLLSLISDLLDLARIESGKVELQREPVVCREVVEEVGATLAPLAAGKGLAFTIRPCDTSLVLQTDRRALTQILINLTGNAIKFTARGRVELRASPRPDAGVIEFSVEDTGVGIRDEDRERLFEAFSRLEAGQGGPEGTGLGLHISHKLTVLLGGSLTFTSAWGRGSTFTLSLPIRG